MDIWLVVSTPLKNMKVSWDDYFQYMESLKIHVPTHQPNILIMPKDDKNHRLCLYGMLRKIVPPTAGIQRKKESLYLQQP